MKYFTLTPQLVHRCSFKSHSATPLLLSFKIWMILTRSNFNGTSQVLSYWAQGRVLVRVNLWALKSISSTRKKLGTDAPSHASSLMVQMKPQPFLGRLRSWRKTDMRWSFLLLGLLGCADYSMSI